MPPRGSASPLLFGYPRRRPINASEDVSSSVLWTNQLFRKSSREQTLCVLPLFPSQGQRGGDTVPQPDLYSGQAVHYIKKTMGLCKAICPTCLPNHLKTSTPGEGEIRLLGEANKSVSSANRRPPPPLSLCCRTFPYSLTALIASHVIADVTPGKVKPSCSCHGAQGSFRISPSVWVCRM